MMLRLLVKASPLQIIWLLPSQEVSPPPPFPSEREKLIWAGWDVSTKALTLLDPVFPISL